MKKILQNIFVFSLLILLFISGMGATFLIPVYNDSYYAGLSVQYDRLKNTNENKVVLVGGSSIAFGTDCQLFEELYHKPLVNVGLYGMFGTKMMMEMSKANLNRGDVVVLSPEFMAASYSTTQNFTALWKAAESDITLLTAPAFSDGDKFVGSFFPYLLEKRDYLLSGEKPINEGIYSRASVNEYGEIAKGLRKGNIMRAGYGGEKFLSKDEISEEFICYVNDYVFDCNLKGVTVYFSFSPLNDKAMVKQGITQNDLYDLYDYLCKSLDCAVISDPTDRIYDYRYFYDTNFHLNDEGSVWNTVQLVRDLKGVTGDMTEIVAPMPEFPEPIQKIVEIDENLNYTDASLFEYEEDDGMLVIVGVKDEVKKLKEVILPVVYEGKYIYNVAGNAFIGCEWERVEVPVGYSELSGGAFRGCSALKEICLHESSGANLNVYDSTFEGVNSACKIILLKADKNTFLNGDGMYMWQRVTLPIEEASK